MLVAENVLVPGMVDHNIWLGSRIKEIMDEKKLTVRGLAKQIGIGRMTLERIIDGRYVRHDELERIASGLGITVERLKQKDMQQSIQEVDELLQSGRNPWRALELAQELTAVAIGRSELVDMYGRLGRALTDLHRYEEAHEILKTAYEWVAESDDSERLLIVSNLLCRSYYLRKDFISLQHFLDEMEEKVVGNAEYLGRVNHYRGICAHCARDYMRARMFYLKGYENYRQAGNHHLIGRMQLNLADLEYLDGKLQASMKLLEQAKINLQNDDQITQTVVEKYMARTLMGLAEGDRALEIVDRQIELLRTSEFKNTELLARFLMMRAEIKEDAPTAELILNLRQISREMKCQVADFLTTLYMKRGDSINASKYFLLLKENLSEKITNYKRSVWF